MFSPMRPPRKPSADPSPAAAGATADGRPGPRSSVRVVKQKVVGMEARAPELDYLAIEDPLEIELVFTGAAQHNIDPRMVTMRTPGYDTDLIHGFLYGEGVIRRADDILGIDFVPSRTGAAPTHARVRLGPAIKPSPRPRRGAVHASCGVCGSASIAALALPPSLRITGKTKVSAEWIHRLPQTMRREQATFDTTGGLHAAAFFNTRGELLVCREDIGRHNALDKVIGAILPSANGPPGRDAMLCVSGRMSYEILQKALVAGIPIICGVGAPSSLAVTLANDFNVTLIGFVRDGSYNIYSCPERLHNLKPV